MTARPFLVFLVVVILTAIFVPPVKSNEIPCLPKEQAKAFEQIENVRGYGIREGALVKLSVSSEGFWLLTLSPPEMNGAVCIALMGTDWHFVTSAAPKEEASWTAR